MSIIYKIFFLILFIIFSLNPVSADQNLINNCNNINYINKDLIIKKIKIEIKNNRKWQINNLQIIIDNTHVIPNKLKKSFKAKLFVTFENNITCNYQAKIRTHGDLKDHINYKDGKVIQSLDVQLRDGQINNITKFKLFLKGTRGKEEDEIFMTEILREFDFISPRTSLVNVEINEEKLEMLFQEKITKELLEFHKRREGPIFEGEEKYMMRYASKIQNKPEVNWPEILRVSEIGSTVQLAKQTNSSWSVKNLVNQQLSFETLSYLNFIYLVYLNSFKDEKNNYFFLDYHLDNNLLGLNINDKIQRLNIYDALILSANGNHALYVHNRKFYWNAIENYFEPIYYDGEFNIEKKPEKLRLGLVSADFGSHPGGLFTLSTLAELSKKSFELIAYSTNADHLQNLNIDKITSQINSKGINFDKSIVKEKIDQIFRNLDVIKNLYMSKKKKDIFYNSNSYKTKNLWNKYRSNLIENNVNIRFLKLIDTVQNEIIFEVCKNNNYQDCEYDAFSTKEVRKLLEGNLNYNNQDYKYIGTLKKPEEKYSRINFKNENFSNVSFYFNKDIEYELDNKNSLLKIYQKNKYGRAFFVNGNIKNIKIIFSGYSKNINITDSNRIDKKTLTGCLTFLKSNFENTTLETSNSNCEDGINLINSSGNISKIISKNSLYDGVDIDFSSLSIKKIEINNSLNDCLDFSFGSYYVKNLELNHCGDKGISVGEKSIAKFKVANISNSNMGIASKDSSSVNVVTSNILNTKICISAYRKKQEFAGAFLKIVNLNCENYQKKINIDKNSKIIFENEL